MQLGLVTYQWGADWDLPTLIKNCQKTGFRGVELRTTHKHGVEPSLDDAAAQGSRQAIRRQPASSWSAWARPANFTRPTRPCCARTSKRPRPSSGCATTWAARASRCAPTACRPACRSAKTIEQIGKSLDEVAAFGEGYGIEIRLEIHGRGTSEIPNIRKIMDVSKHPGSKLCWNCNAEDTGRRRPGRQFRLASRTASAPSTSTT